MKTVLVYPPPWKLPDEGQVLDCFGDGPPSEFQGTDLDGDFFQMPYGLLTLGACALEASHRVKLLNLSAFPWTRVENAIQALSADVFGLSCYTANRRGVALVAHLIKRFHPHAHVTVGGPHATALPKEMLAFHPSIDSVVIGEGEMTLLELLDRLKRHVSLEGVQGLAHRHANHIVVEKRRERIRDLDTLANPHRTFRTHLLMTSRGCPGECTFCAKAATWGRVYRAHSIAYVLDSLEASLAKLPVRMIQIKDDTFTTDRKRVIRLCEAIRERQLNFLWSCDTRADVLDDSVLRAMRLAGCVRLSLGVESGSPIVLNNIRKRVRPEQVLSATRAAKKYGFQVRFFMMLGNRGETLSTFRKTLDFVREAAPHQAIFSCLSVYPGTSDFETMESRGWLDKTIYFSEDFQELKTPFDASEEDTRIMSEWFENNRGLRRLHQPSVQETKDALALLGDLSSAHLDVAGALYREGALEEAEEFVNQALALGYPAPGLAHNYLACIAAQRADHEAMVAHFEAAKTDPLHPVLMRNLQKVRTWQQRGQTQPLVLEASHDFELLEQPEQPSLPGPLATDFALW